MSVTTARAPSSVFDKPVTLLAYISDAGYQILVNPAGDVVLDPAPMSGGPLASALRLHRQPLAFLISRGFHAVPAKATKR